MITSDSVMGLEDSAAVDLENPEIKTANRTIPAINAARILLYITR